MCFQNKLVTNPIAVMCCYACSLMSYWAGLFCEADKEELVAGVDKMLKIALQLVKETQGSK